MRLTFRLHAEEHPMKAPMARASKRMPTVFCMNLSHLISESSGKWAACGESRKNAMSTHEARHSNKVKATTTRFWTYLSNQFVKHWSQYSPCVHRKKPFQQASRQRQRARLHCRTKSCNLSQHRIADLRR